METTAGLNLFKICRNETEVEREKTFFFKKKKKDNTEGRGVRGKSGEQAEEEEEEEEWRRAEKLISGESVGCKDGRCDH